MNCRLLKHFPYSMARGFLTAAELSLNLSSIDAFSLQCHSDYLPLFYHDKTCSFFFPNLFCPSLCPRLFCFLFSFSFGYSHTFSSQPWGTSAQDSSGFKETFTYVQQSLDPFIVSEDRHTQGMIQSLHLKWMK